MANYNAGDLNLNIRTSAEDTLKYLDAVVERLTFIDKHLGGIRGNSYIKKSISKTPKSNGGLFGLAKIGITIHAVRRLGRFMGNLVQAGSDYTETLNLWQVAMRNNLGTAEQFINKMQKAYGISSKTLMNAQAIFKNMIGSLGQISDETAYKLSEALVQMSADFSSLYNVKLESAFEKMQSMLAGQVRPIRSAGLDMTETTLFQYYQQLGGTKTMRQLNRTEKQLLSILAVFKQMGSAGALGDMTKTLNSFANQSRMMTQYWQELKTWSGLLLKDLIDQSGMLIYINAALITTTEIIKAIAKSRGLGEENFIEGLFETTEATNDEVDELQGKLLDFDKFRSLEGAGQSELAIDEKLLEAITGYSSQVDQAENEARKIADSWLAIIGFTEGENGQLEYTGNLLDDISKKYSKIFDIISKFAPLLLSGTILKNSWISGIVSLFIYGYRSNEKFRQSVINLKDALIPIGEKLMEILPKIIDGLVPILNFFAKFITFLDNAGLLEPILWRIINGLIFMKSMQIVEYISKFAGAFSSLSQKINTNTFALNTNNIALQKTRQMAQSVTMALTAMVASYSRASSIINSFSGTSRKIASWAMIIVGAIVAVTAAIVAMNTAVSWGTALPVLLAGVGAAIAGVQGLAPTVQMAAVGASNLDSGTLFVAGEMGKTEAVFEGANGKTNVANIQQMEVAFYNALVRYGKSNPDSKIEVVTYLDGEKVYQNTTNHAKQRGNVWSKA